MKLTVFLAVASAFALLTSTEAAIADHLTTFETHANAPMGWSQGLRANPSTILAFSIAVQQPRAGEFEQHVMNLATPGHFRYGDHMSYPQIKQFLSPSEDSIQSILSWLLASNVENNTIIQETDWIKFKATVGQVESMLDTEFYYFTKNDTSVIRTWKYSLPASLHNAVRMIQPTTRFNNIRPQFDSIISNGKAVTPPKPTGYDAVKCNFTITPDCLRGLYKLDNFTANSFVGNKLGISGFLDEYARYSDLDLFAKDYAPYATINNFTVEDISGGLDLQHSSAESGEANLDIQYGLALAAGTPVTFYTTGGRGVLVPDLDQPNEDDNSNEPYLEQLQYILSLPDDDLPSVLSTSYGEDEQSIPPSYANTTCLLFAQLGARGVSVIFSSGDSGVGSACQTNDGQNTTRFLPTFPASCPFVTSVGGTRNVNPEIATSFSSGGFSDLFPRPAYQEQAVCKYLDHLGDKWEGLYNPLGRGFPDVSAQSSNFYVYDHGQVGLYSGTSCSAPVFASIIANMNSLRLTLGLPSLGFLNPFLYAHGVEGLTDITSGGSRGCTGYDAYSGLEAPFVEGAGWNATVGWDPVTGLGTPVFPKLVEAMFRYAGGRNFSRRGMM